MFIVFITARNEVGARLCFYMCLWFCPQGGLSPEADTPPEQTPLGADNPQCSACWEILATSGQYASYWNAFLCIDLFTMSICVCEYDVSNKFQYIYIIYVTQRGTKYQNTVIAIAHAQCGYGPNKSIGYWSITCDVKLYAPGINNHPVLLDHFVLSIVEVS